MKQLIQNLGLIIFMIAILLLIFNFFQNTRDNILLILSGALIVVGLAVHVIVNKKIEEE
jgi:hypothetical protein